MMINYSFFPILSINEDVPTSYKPIFTDHSPIHAVDVYLMLLRVCCYCCPPLSPFQSASFIEWGPVNGCIRHYISEPLNPQIQSLQGMCVYLHLCLRPSVYMCVDMYSGYVSMWTCSRRVCVMTLFLHVSLFKGLQDVTWG